MPQTTRRVPRPPRGRFAAFGCVSPRMLEGTPILFDAKSRSPPGDVNRICETDGQQDCPRIRGSRREEAPNTRLQAPSSNLQKKPKLRAPKRRRRRETDVPRRRQASMFDLVPGGPCWFGSLGFGNWSFAERRRRPALRDDAPRPETLARSGHSNVTRSHGAQLRLRSGSQRTRCAWSGDDLGKAARPSVVADRSLHLGEEPPRFVGERVLVVQGQCLLQCRGAFLLLLETIVGHAEVVEHLGVRDALLGTLLQ